MTIRSLAFASLSLVGFIGSIAGCAKAPPRAEIPPPEATSWIREDDISPPKRPHIEIMNLEENVSPDAGTVTVTGTLINRGEAPTATLDLQVNGLNDAGATVTTSRAQPASERVPVNGVTTFSAVLVNRPDVRHYHVEAVAR